MRKTAYALMGLILLSIFIPGVQGEQVNEAIIYSEYEGSNVRFYAKENATSYIYENITILFISSEPNSTALVFFDDKMKDAFNFSYQEERHYKVNSTTDTITVIINNTTHKFRIRITRNNNLDEVIQEATKNLKYSEKEVQEIIRHVKLEMLYRTAIGFIVGFVIIAYFTVRRLRNEIQPVL